MVLEVLLVLVLDPPVADESAAPQAAPLLDLLHDTHTQLTHTCSNTHCYHGNGLLHQVSLLYLAEPE